MRLTMRDLGIIIIIIITVEFQTFFWSLSILNFADRRAITSESFPWHFGCCSASDPSWKQSWKERSLQLQAGSAWPGIFSCCS